jgi:hypothetical protein
MATRPARHLPPPPLQTPWWQRGRPLSQPAWRQLVEQQCGLTLRAQAHDAGFTDQQILWRVRTGRWELVAAGVYLTTVGRDDVGMWSVAAVLASAQIAPPTSPPSDGLVFGSAALSHRSAAFLQGLGPAPQVVDLLVDHRRRVRPAPGIRLHRSRFLQQRLDPTAWPWRTAVEHTVFDLADTMPLDGAIAVVVKAVSTQRTTPASLRLALAGRSRQRWRAELIEMLTPAAAGAESVLELRFVKGVLRPHGLPLGESQQHTRAGRHDRRYAALRLLVELDGWAWHGDPGARAHDNRRDRVAAIDGWLTTRAGWREVVGAPCQLAWELGRLMQARGWSGVPRRCRLEGCGATALGSKTFTGLQN